MNVVGSGHYTAGPPPTPAAAVDPARQTVSTVFWQTPASSAIPDRKMQGGGSLSAASWSYCFSGG